MSEELILSANYELIQDSGVDRLLIKIRPAWQAKKLIQRVKNLLPADPSSACQRIINATIHDLKQKIIILGIDIAKETAERHQLPPINKSEDIENYTTMRLIDLSYRIGLLTRPEYKKILRVYDIRKDLEHEDDEYEAGIEDCIYIFATCINIVLSKDHIELIRVNDVKEIIQHNQISKINAILIEEYKIAPLSRQLDINKYLISESQNTSHPDIVRQNAFIALTDLSLYTSQPTLLELTKFYSDRIGKRTPTIEEVRIAVAANIFLYLKQSQIKSFFGEYLQKMKREGYHWKKSSSHGELLRNLKEIGGLKYCPESYILEYYEWLILCYIGEKGGYGHGYSRPVFYSNTGAPLSYEIIETSKERLKDLTPKILTSKSIKSTTLQSNSVNSRFEQILDIYNE